MKGIHMKHRHVIASSVAFLYALGLALSAEYRARRYLPILRYCARTLLLLAAFSLMALYTFDFFRYLTVTP